MYVEIRSAFTDAEDGKCVADLELLLQEIQERSVILLEEMLRGQSGDLQSHTVLNRGVQEDQEFDGHFGDHVRMLAVIAGHAQRVADLYTCT
jgi:hypothetical protein